MAEVGQHVIQVIDEGEGQLDEVRDSDSTALEPVSQEVMGGQAPWKSRKRRNHGDLMKDANGQLVVKQGKDAWRQHAGKMQIFLLVRIVAVLICINGVWLLAEENLKIIDKEKAMFGSSSLTSYQEAERLFREKEKSIPFLIGYFDDQTPYFGYLGSNLRISNNLKSRKVTKEDIATAKAIKEKYPNGVFIMLPKNWTRS